MGEKYRHYKGKEYDILCFAKNGETLEKMVVYKALYGEGEFWVRLYDMFFEIVTLGNGSQVPRFIKMA